jgi:hypothetical protein
MPTPVRFNLHGSASPLAQLQQRAINCRLSGDLPGLLKCVASLERSPEAGKDFLITAYTNVARLAREKGRADIGIDYCLKLLKCLEPDASPIDKVRAVGLLVETALGLEKIDQARQEAGRNRIEAFVRGVDFDLLPVEEKRNWLGLLENVFPFKFIELKERFCDDLFRDCPEPIQKGHIILAYLLNTKRKNMQRPGSVAPEAARAKAEYLLRQAPSVVADRRESSAEVFHTLIINLLALGLNDLADEALNLRSPESADPIFDYVRLSRSLDTNPARAFAEVMQLTPSGTTIVRWGRTIVEAFKVLTVRLLKASLEANRAALFEAALPLTAGDDRPTLDYCAAPRGERMELVREIRAIRAQNLSALADIVRGGGYYLETMSLSGIIKEDGDEGQRKAYLVIDPHAGAVELYLPAPTRAAYIKVRFPFTRDQTGKPTGINPQAVFDGVADEAQAQVPFLWDYIALQAYLRAPDPELMRGLKEKLARAVEAQSAAGNRSRFEKLAAAFAADDSFLIRQIALDNRLLVARKLMGFGWEAKPGEHVLGADDLLKDLVKKVTIQDPQSSAMALETAQGETIFFSLNGLETIVVPGVADDASPLLRRYILELAQTTLIKINCSADGKKATPRPVAAGYLIEAGQEPEKEGRSGLHDLLSIYKWAIYDRIRTQGLLRAADWFRQRDDLLIPLEDQSLAAKKKALETTGAGGLFFPLEPLGITRRLPVRRKKEHGVMTIAPWERSPLRLEQQRLLGDTRPLKDLHALYIITTFSDGRQHLRLYAFSEDEAKVLNERSLETLDRELGEGKFRTPEVLFKGTKRATREALAKGLASGDLTITDQRYELFYPIQRTICRPEMISIAALIDQGFVLK